MIDSKAITGSDKGGVHTLVMAAWEFGVEHVIICPGSRNAPLTIAFNRSGLFTCHSIADERSAAFFALGLALATGKPVLIHCTSGSAGINFAPAMAEAYYLRIPLIAVTADRPSAWTDQGDGQTIRQEGLFANFVRSAISLIASPHSATDDWQNRRKLSEAFNIALSGNAGPVHINLPMAEPLYNTARYETEAKPNFFRRASVGHILDPAILAFCGSKLTETKKVMVVVGQMMPDQKLNEVLAKIAQRENVVVLTETTSNLHGAHFIDTIDRIVMSVREEQHLTAIMPDLLITMGDAVVSKKIKSLLRKFPPTDHWHIHPQSEGMDTYQRLTLEIPMDASLFCEQLNEVALPSQTSTYRELWQSLMQQGRAAHSGYLDGLAFSDFKAFETLLAAYDKSCTIHLGNSTPVRYSQLFGGSQHATYHANRGTSGIDGCTSTASGWAKVRPDDEILLITGDVAFLYDSNALWNRNLPPNLKIAVINNSGGGIFRIVDGADQIDELENYFEAHHPVDIQTLAKAYGVPTFLAEDEKSLEKELTNFMSHQGVALLEIRTPRLENAQVLAHYFDHIATKFKKEIN